MFQLVMILLALNHLALTCNGLPAAELTISVTTSAATAGPSASGSDKPLFLRLFIQSLIYECKVEPVALSTEYSCTATVVGFTCPDLLDGDTPLLHMRNNDSDDVHISSVRISGIQDFIETSLVADEFCLIHDGFDIYGSNITNYAIGTGCFGNAAAFLTSDICINNGPGCSPAEQLIFWLAHDFAAGLPNEAYPVDRFINATCAPSHQTPAPVMQQADPNTVPNAAPNVLQSPSPSAMTMPSVQRADLSSGSNISPSAVSSTEPRQVPTIEAHSDSDDSGSADDAQRRSERLTADEDISYVDVQDDSYYTKEILCEVGSVVVLAALIVIMLCVWFRTCKVFQ